MRVEHRGGSWHVVEGRGVQAASESGPLPSDAAAHAWLRDFERSHQLSLHDEQCQNTALERACARRGDGWSGSAAPATDESSQMRWHELLASAAAIADKGCTCGRMLSRQGNRV